MRHDVEVRPGCLSTPAVMDDGTRGTAFVPRDYAEYVAKGPAWKFEQLLHLVPTTLETPTAVFRGLRDEEPTWYAYVSKPSVNYEGYREGNQVAADPDHVFVVYLTDRREVFRFEWLEADPHDSKLPTNHSERYAERIF